MLENIIISCIGCMNSYCVLIMCPSCRDALLSSHSASACILFPSNSKNLLSDSFDYLSSCSNTSAILLSASLLFLWVPVVKGVLLTVVVVVVVAGIHVPVGPLSSSSVVSPSLFSPLLLSASPFSWWGALSWSSPYSSSSSASSSSAIWCLSPSSCADSESCASVWVAAVWAGGLNRRLVV